MAQHTPEPWAVAGRLVSDTVETVGGYYIVRQMLPPSPGKAPWPASDEVVAFVRDFDDAKLLAAAPDLLAALKAFVAAEDSWRAATGKGFDDPLSDAYDAAVAAIARAGG